MAAPNMPPAHIPTGISYEEMEAKRQEMVASFKDMAAAMTRCVALIEDFARLSPSSLTTSAALAAVEHGAFTAETLAAAAAGKKVRRQKEKKPKDPNAPKRPPSAYLMYQNSIREEIRTQNPAMPYKEVLGVAADRWKHLTDIERKKFENAYVIANNVFRKQEDLHKAGLPWGHVVAEAVQRGELAQLPPALTATLGGAILAEQDDSSSEEESSEDLPAPTQTLTPTPATKDKKRKGDDLKGDKKKKK